MRLQVKGKYEIHKVRTPENDLIVQGIGRLKTYKFQIRTKDRRILEEYTDVRNAHDFLNRQKR